MKCEYSNTCKECKAKSSQECEDFKLLKKEEEDWYQEEMAYQQNIQDSTYNMYHYDEQGFCDGFPS